MAILERQEEQNGKRRADPATTVTLKLSSGICCWSWCLFSAGLVVEPHGSATLQRQVI